MEDSNVAQQWPLRLSAQLELLSPSHSTSSHEYLELAWRLGELNSFAQHTPLLTRRPTRCTSSDTRLGGATIYVAPGTINGIPVDALPDTGSSVHAIAEDFANRHCLKIETIKTKPIKLFGGHAVEIVGRFIGYFKFSGETHSHRREFHVLRNGVRDVVLGKQFLKQTQTLTEHQHRIVKKTQPCFRNGNRLFLLEESAQERLRCNLNGAKASALPDTGANLMLVSGDFVRRNKFKVNREEKYRRIVQAINGSTVRTDGMVLGAELEFDVPPRPSYEIKYDHYLDFTSDVSSYLKKGESASKTKFICDLHVIDNLPCDIILSDDFIFENQVYSRFKNLFYSIPNTALPDNTSPNDSILFVKLVKRKTRSVFRRRRSPQPDQNLIPLQIDPTWDKCWQLELERRNTMQLWIVTLSGPERSNAQRIESETRDRWDRDNPRPRVVLGTSSDTSQRQSSVSTVPVITRSAVS